MIACPNRARNSSALFIWHRAGRYCLVVDGHRTFKCASSETIIRFDLSAPNHFRQQHYSYRFRSDSSSQNGMCACPRWCFTASGRMSRAGQTPDFRVDTRNPDPQNAPQNNPARGFTLSLPCDRFCSRLSARSVGLCLHISRIAAGVESRWRLAGLRNLEYQEVREWSSVPVVRNLTSTTPPVKGCRCG